MPRLRSIAYTLPTLAMLGVGYVLAFGLGYGSGNLQQYLLHGLHELNPTFLANDWFTTQTWANHGSFSLLIRVLHWITDSRLDAGFAIANAAADIVFVLCVYRLAARYFRAPLVVTALVLLFQIFTPVPMIGMCSLTSRYFQPSVIGAVGMLAGLVLLIERRHLLAGVALGVASLFHVNYMVWIVVVVGLFVLVQRRQLGWRGCLAFLLPMVPGIACHVPYLIEMRSAEQAVFLVEARRVIQDVYAPCHYRPRTWGVTPFMRLAVGLVAGMASLYFVRPRTDREKRGITVVVSLFGIVATGFLLTIVVPTDAVELLFPFRIAPVLLVFSQVAVCGALVHSCLGLRIGWLSGMFVVFLLLGMQWISGVSDYGLITAAALLAPLAGRNLVKHGNQRVWIGLLVVGAMLVVGGLTGVSRGSIVYASVLLVAAAAWKVGGPILERWRLARGWLLRGHVLFPIVVGVLLLQMGAKRKDFLGPPPPGDDQLLYDWCRARTQRGDVFMIPPLLSGFRLGAERAVVVDFKCMPLIPTDAVEWYRRMAGMCGGDFHTAYEAEDHYNEMSDAARRRAAAALGATYIVARRDGSARADGGGRTAVYSNATYEVLRQANGESFQAMSGATE